MLSPVQIIKAKRHHKELSEKDIQNFINGFLNGDVTDYQMSAFLMAVHFNGMTDNETFYLTEAFINSGKTIDLSNFNKFKVDKHSIGGVGDKTSLIIAPLIATFNLIVPMIAGRGLGHTGGTLDKLESIQGYSARISVNEFIQNLEKSNVSLIGQTDEIVPADRKIYAIRDVTGTVDCIPLFVSSIVSKKIAEDADGLVYDVKIGKGSNLPDDDEAVKLAKKLVEVTKKFGKKSIAVLTDMNEPLGNKIGNWNEVEECIAVMKGEKVDDLVKVTSVLCGAMLFMSGVANSIEEGEKISSEKIANENTYKKFEEMIANQYGDIEYLKNYDKKLRSKISYDIVAEEDGIIAELNAYNIGYASIELGAGRKKSSDKIDFLSGIDLHKKCGAEIKRGEVICSLYAETQERIDKALFQMQGSIKISKSKPQERILIKDIIY
ncbi:MAG TPA: thymidine phosphorylase [Ignavibacteria bacterium]|nr:thymidine phosphorylase [Ignavibacteria bacterium]